MREKLTELVNDILSYLPWGQISTTTAQEVADHLIANGVTFATDNNVGSRWIPVTERLPENEKPYEEYLVNIMEDHFPISTWDDDPYCTERVTVAQFDDKQKLWYLHGGNTALNALVLPEDSRVNTECVTHWMPLPKPPKEVE